jgi:acyl-coenzyme A thioesterase PaaI-like protein
MPAMNLFQRAAELIGERNILRALSFYPPYLGAGVSVKSVADDFTRIEVRMKLRPWNQNYVGTQFGGSLYSMCDPFFMLLTMRQVGPGYVVWDKSATIDFLKPGRGTVRAVFEVPRARAEEIRTEADRAGKAHPRFEAMVETLDGEAIARVTKILSVRPARLAGNRQPPAR